MSSIQFVFEATENPPPPVEPPRKRNRIVTSCDACRFKKVKCLPTGFGDGFCKTCVKIGQECTYSDRDRFREKRGIAQFTVAPQSAGAHAQGPTPGPSNPLVVRADRTFKIRKENRYDPASTKALTKSGTPGFRLLGSPLLDVPGSNAPFNDPFLPLFHPSRSRYPNPQLLPHFAHLFLYFTAGKLSFIEPDLLVAAAASGAMPQTTANCVAAYAARFSDRIRHPISRSRTGDAYLEIAKSLLANADDEPSLENLQNLLIVARIESGSGRGQSGFYGFSHRAALMASKLKLDLEETILAYPRQLQHALRTTFFAAVWLDLLSSFSANQIPAIDVEKITTNAPAIVPTILPISQGVPKRVVSRIRPIKDKMFKFLYVFLKKLVELNQWWPARIPCARRDIELSHFRVVLDIFHRELPPFPFFTPETVQEETIGDIIEFSQLHVSTNIVSICLHIPQIFFTTSTLPFDQDPAPPSMIIAKQAARSLVDIISAIDALSDAYICGLTGYVIPIVLARATFNVEAHIIKSTMQEGPARRVALEQVQVYRLRCRDLLHRMSTYWGAAMEIEFRKPGQAERTVMVPRPHPRTEVNSNSGESSRATSEPNVDDACSGVNPKVEDCTTTADGLGMDDAARFPAYVRFTESPLTHGVTSSPEPCQSPMNEPGIEPQCRTPPRTLNVHAQALPVEFNHQGFDTGQGVSPDGLDLWAQDTRHREDSTTLIQYPRPAVEPTEEVPSGRTTEPAFSATCEPWVSPSLQVTEDQQVKNVQQDTDGTICELSLVTLDPMTFDVNDSRLAAKQNEMYFPTSDYQRGDTRGSPYDGDQSSSLVSSTTSNVENVDDAEYNPAQATVQYVMKTVWDGERDVTVFLPQGEEPVFAIPGVVQPAT